MGLILLLTPASVGRNGITQAIEESSYSLTGRVKRPFPGSVMKSNNGRKWVESKTSASNDEDAESKKDATVTESRLVPSSLNTITWLA